MSGFPCVTIMKENLTRDEIFDYFSSLINGTAEVLNSKTTLMMIHTAYMKHCELSARHRTIRDLYADNTMRVDEIVLMTELVGDADEGESAIIKTIEHGNKEALYTFVIRGKKGSCYYEDFVSAMAGFMSCIKTGRDDAAQYIIKLLN